MVISLIFGEEISFVYTESITAKSLSRGTFIQYEIVPLPIPMFPPKSSKLVSRSDLNPWTGLKEASIQTL